MDETFKKPAQISELFNASDTLSRLTVSERNRIEHEYQELCLENQDIFGRAFTWSLPYKPRMTDRVLREAFKIAKGRNVEGMPMGKRRGYLLGIIKRLVNS